MMIITGNPGKLLKLLETSVMIITSRRVTVKAECAAVSPRCFSRSRPV
jgi:hypothetical protein